MSPFQPRRPGLWRSLAAGARGASLLLALTGPAAAQTGFRNHLSFRADAEAAYQRKDYAAAAAAVREALKLRPDSPRYLHNLAALSALQGRPAEAIEYLQRLAALGVTAAIERDPDLATLQGRPEFQAVLSGFAANRTPRGQVDRFAELPGRTGIIEGLAWRESTGDVFLSDVHHRCIWRRTRSGQLTRFTPEFEELMGLFGLAIDESRKSLWAAMSAVPEMDGFIPEMKGHGGLAEFDLNTGELRRLVFAPDDGREHLINDLTLGPDGVVYASDSRSPVIWTLAPDAEEFQKVVESPAFNSLQGLLLQPGTLLAADHSHGLVAIDLATRNAQVLEPPENTTLLGLDGIVAIPGGLIATQNGTTPHRLLRVQLTPDFRRITGVEVLASGQPEMTDLTLVTLVQDRPLFIAGSGWEVFDRARPGSDRAHPVFLLQADLP